MTFTVQTRKATRYDPPEFDTARQCDDCEKTELWYDGDREDLCERCAETAAADARADQDASERDAHLMAIRIAEAT